MENVEADLNSDCKMEVVEIVEVEGPPKTTSRQIENNEDGIANRLYRACKKNKDRAEEAALSFLTTDLHHPVISCFREITKADISYIFSNSKVKKNFKNLELCIVCLGMVDYLATCINNPLYNEAEKISEKNIPILVTKILQELKGTLRVWGLNDQKIMKDRMQVVFSFLRRLTPFFKPVMYDVAYLNLIDSIEDQVTTRKNTRARNPIFTPIVTGEVEKSVLLEVDTNRNVSKNSFDESGSGENAKQLQPNLNSIKQSTATTPVSTKDTTSNMSAKRSSDDNIEVITIQSPKKLKMTASASKKNAFEIMMNQNRPSTSNDEKGTVKNAFEMMMSQSRQLGKMRKSDGPPKSKSNSKG